MKKLLIALGLVLVVTALTLSSVLAQGPPLGVPPEGCQEALDVARGQSGQPLHDCGAPGA